MGKTLFKKIKYAGWDYQTKLPEKGTQRLYLYNPNLSTETSALNIERISIGSYEAVDCIKFRSSDAQKVRSNISLLTIQQNVEEMTFSEIIDAKESLELIYQLIDSRVGKKAITFSGKPMGIVAGFARAGYPHLEIEIISGKLYAYIIILSERIRDNPLKEGEQKVSIPHLNLLTNFRR